MTTFWLTSNQKTWMGQTTTWMACKRMAKTIYITTTTTTIIIMNKRTRMRGVGLSWELIQTALDQLLQLQWVLRCSSCMLKGSQPHKCLISIPSLSICRFKLVTLTRFIAPHSFCTLVSCCHWTKWMFNSSLYPACQLSGWNPFLHIRECRDYVESLTIFLETTIAYLMEHC